MSRPHHMVHTGSGNPKLDGLIDWFLHYSKGLVTSAEVLSHELLNKKLSDVLREKLNQKQLSLILFHTVVAIEHGVYGAEDRGKMKARRVVENYIQRWADKFIPKLSKHEEEGKNGISRTIAEVLSAFRSLNLQPPERLTRVLQDTALRHIKEFNIKDIDSMGAAFGTLALPMDDALLAACANRIKELSPQFSPLDALGFLYGLAIVDAVQDTHRGPERFQLKDTAQALIDDNNFRKKIDTAINSDARSRKLWDSMYWFFGQDPSRYPKETDTESLFEGDAKVAFERSGAKSLRTDSHPITGKRPDLRAEFNGKAFVVECDGPTHFVRRADDHCVVLNGNTILQTALDARRKPDEPILRLPVDLFYAHREDTHFWRHVLEKTPDVESGRGYIIAPDGVLIPLGKGYDPNPDQLS